LRQLATRATLLTRALAIVLLQMRNRDNFGVGRRDLNDRIILESDDLSGWLDLVAVRPARHDAVLHPAGGGEIVCEPHADCKKNNGNDQACDRTAPVIALLGVGHRRTCSPRTN
jgi:hypothetical protein